MAATTRFHGRHGQLSLDGTIIVGLDKWDLDLDAPMSDSTGFGDANQTETIGIPKRSGVFSGYADYSCIAAVMAASKSVAPIDIVLTPTTDLTQAFAGPGWVTLKWTVSAKDTIKIDGKFTASGAWTDTIANI